MKFCYTLLFGILSCIICRAQNTPPAELRLIGFTATGSYGQKGNAIYKRPSLEAEWQPIFTLQGLRGQASLVNQDTLLFTRNDDSLFYYNLTGKLLGKAEKDEMIENFCKAGINSIVFRKGSVGCFHSYEDRISYTNDDRVFTEIGETSTGTRHHSKLPRYRLEIDEKHIRDFVKIIPALFKPSSGANINQLGFAPAHYAHCKSQVKKLETCRAANSDDMTGLGFYYIHNNKLPDFQRIYRLIDSVKNLDHDILYNFFQFGDFLVSTTSQYIAIDLINDDRKVLTISTSFSEPNAFYMPWKLRLNGYEYSSTGMQINQFIRKVYPALLKDESKSNTLHKLISYLYFSTDIAK